MRSSLQSCLALSLALSSLLYGANEVTIDTKTSTAPGSEWRSHISGSGAYTEFGIIGSGNILHWNGTPSLASDVKLSISAGKGTDVKNSTLNFNANGSDRIENIYGAIGSIGYGLAEGNTLNLNGGNVGWFAYGAYAIRDAIKNTLNVSGGNFTHGSPDLNGGWSSMGNANENTVNIKSGANIKDDTRIYGGYSSSNGKEARGNTVNIEGGSFGTNVDLYGGKSNTGTATNNTVNLLISDMDMGGVRLYGGRSDVILDQLTGNTLNVKGKNIKANWIEYFEFLNFYIPKGFDVAKDRMLSLTVGADLEKSKIGVAMMEGGKLYKDDKITLIEAEKGITYPTDMNNHTGNLQKGISKVYTFKLDKDSKNKKLLAVVTEVDTSKPVDPKPTDPSKPVDPKPTDPSKPSDPKPDNTMLPYPKNVVETTIGELGILSSSLDLASSMSLSTDSNGAFGSTSASNTRLKSGSHVDVKSFNAAVGLAKEFEGNQIGAFVEFGGGKYDSFNDFDKIDVRGNGKFKYIGLGIATKFSLPNSFYLSSSFKAGKIKSDYESDIPALTTPKYEATRSYYGAHLGLGKIVELNDVSNIDIYSKVFFNKLGSKEIEIVGDRILLKPTISLSAKFGARYNYTLNEKLDIYTGASYEREFKGEAKGYNITHDVDIASPSIKGSTYNAEIGAKLNTTNNLKLDFNLQGMTGKKRGVNGGIGIEWRF